MIKPTDLERLQIDFEYELFRRVENDEMARDILAMVGKYQVDSIQLKREQRKGRKQQKEVAGSIKKSSQGKRVWQSNRTMNNKLTTWKLWLSEPKKQLLRSIVTIGRIAFQWLKQGV